jgi:carbonic anhydrase
MTNRNKIKVHLLQLGEKALHLDNGKEYNLPQMMAHLYQELEMKEKALDKLHVIIKETKEGQVPLIVKKMDLNNGMVVRLGA